MADPARYLTALAAVCAQSGLDGHHARTLHIRANAVFHLPREGVVVRLRSAPGPTGEVMERLTAAIQVTRWLRAQSFPATEPIDIDQPMAVDGYLATFWRYVPVTSEAERDVSALGHLLRRLHGLPMPAVKLPAANPLGSLRTDLRHCHALSPGDRDWLLARASELERQFSGAQWVLGIGLVHGDAHAGNLLHSPGEVMLCDWDSVSCGPRELDLVPTSMWRRYGRVRSEWDEFCAAYHVRPRDLPGLPLLQQLRELRALAAYVRNAADPAFKAELTRRISSLQVGTNTAPWRAL